MNFFSCQPFSVHSCSPILTDLLTDGTETLRVFAILVIDIPKSLTNQKQYNLLALTTIRSFVWIKIFSALILKISDKISIILVSVIPDCIILFWCFSTSCASIKRRSTNPLSPRIRSSLFKNVSLLLISRTFFQPP